MVLRPGARKSNDTHDARRAGDRLAGAVAPLRAASGPPPEGGSPREWPQAWLVGEPTDSDADFEVLARASGEEMEEGNGSVAAGPRRRRSRVADVRDRSWAALDPGRGGLRAIVAALSVAAALTVLVLWLQRPDTATVALDGPPATATSQAGTDTGTDTGTGTGTDQTEEPGGAMDDAGDVAVDDAADDVGASPTLVVSVVGRVARPGLAHVPEGARVADALEAVGGPLPDADLASVNLAAVLADGEQVVVRTTDGGSGPAQTGAGGSAASSSTGSAAQGPLDLNSATVEELDRLPGVGPVLAQRIVDWRRENGRFASVEDLRRVSGIGNARFEDLRRRVRV